MKLEEINDSHPVQATVRDVANRIHSQGRKLNILPYLWKEVSK